MSNAKETLARKLVDVFATKKSIEMAFRNFALNMERNGNKNGGIVFRKMVESDIVDKILEDSCGLLMSKFTLSELRGICAFHESPLGKKYRCELPCIQRELTQISQQHIEQELKKEMNRGNGDDEE